MGVLSSYSFFLLRRPISGSNSHYLARRIEGLKSLAPLLEQSSVAGFRDVARVLRTLQPASFARLGRELQFKLAMVQKAVPFPPDYLISSQSPSPDFFCDIRRVKLIL